MFNFMEQRKLKVALALYLCAVFLNLPALAFNSSSDSSEDSQERSADGSADLLPYPPGNRGPPSPPGRGEKPAVTAPKDISEWDYCPPSYFGPSFKENILYIGITGRHVDPFVFYREAVFDCNSTDFNRLPIPG